MLGLSQLGLFLAPRGVAPAYGVNVVQNGDFGSGDLTGWVTANSGAATISVVSGAATWATNGTDIARLRQQLAVDTAKVYMASSTGTTGIFFGTTAGGNDLGSVTTASRRAFIFSTATPWLNTSTNVNGTTLDNVEVREILAPGLGPNLGADGYTLVQAGTGTAVESSPGVYDLTGDGTNNQIARRSYTVESAAQYLLEFDVSQNAGQVLVGTTSGGSTLLAATTINVGAGKYLITATGTTTMWVEFRKSGANTCRISGISLRKII